MTAAVINVVSSRHLFILKSRALYNFVIDIFPVSRTVLVIETLTTEFVAREHCKQSHRVAHSHSTIIRYHVYEYRCCYSDINWAEQDFPGTLYVIIHIYFPIIIYKPDVARL